MRYQVGGRHEDYLAIHEKIDSTKIAYGKAQHRCVFHSTFGIEYFSQQFAS
ncbi:DUF6915 family protein [Pantanalinema rosaneae CENA516]|uniref:DUF6915 family protein n=1 Tax=Pantanalinema rosaneae TaxID=1620701 RepID=UPI003D6E282F